MAKNIKNLIRSKLNQLTSNYKSYNYNLFDDNLTGQDYDILYHPEIINKTGHNIHKYHFNDEDFGISKKTKFNKAKNIINKI